MRRGKKKSVLLPARGKIRRLLECATSREVMEKVEIVGYSEADPLIDSSELDVDLLMQSVAYIRERTRRETNILIPSGTDNVVYTMHALAEGVRPEVLGDNNIIVVVSQTHAPLVAEGQVISEEDPLRHCEPVDNLNNAIYLSTVEDMRGRIGLYCGGVLLPPRGLVKMDTKDPQPFRCRFDPIATSKYPPRRRWFFREEALPTDLPRGKEHPYELADGVESWGFDPLSNYRNLVSAMEGMIRRKRGDGNRAPRSQRSDFSAMVVQAPGSSNLRQSEKELACVNEAAEIGQEADVPVVLISDPLQPHDWGGGEGGGRDYIYGGDFALMRDLMDRAAGGRGKSPVLSGGKLARSEAKLLVSQAVRRGVETHGLHGRDLIKYVQKAFTDYEAFLAGR